MTRGWLIAGLVLVMCGLLHAEGTGTCPRITAPFEVENPSEVCLDVNLCDNQLIMIKAKRCTANDRITIWFNLAEANYVNPQFDMRFGYGGRYLYQVNNRGVNGWGKEQIFAKPMDLGPDQDFALEIHIRFDSIIEWRIDGDYIGMYVLRDNAKVQDIKQLCITRCIAVNTVEFGTIF